MGSNIFFFLIMKKLISKNIYSIYNYWDFYYYNYYKLMRLNILLIGNV